MPKRLGFPTLIAQSSLITMTPFSKNTNVEPEKLIAERINGWAAMLGFFAAVGAYLTTGQIIPGVV